MSIICYDFETYFSCKDYSLSKMGPIEYIRDERFDPFMVSIGTDSRPVSVWANSPESPTMVKAALEGYIILWSDIRSEERRVGKECGS